MPVIQCPNGHYYDTEKNSSCPWCGVSNLDPAMTVPYGRADAVGEDRTIAIPNGGRKASDETVALRPHQVGASSPEGATVAVIKKKLGIDPVVGWLVCVKGPEKGRDYRIHTEKNYLGRADSMDIVVSGDDSISRANHAVITYDPKKKAFRIAKNEGRGLVYVNDNEIDGCSELRSYDVIDMGESTFVFIAFCSDRFDWEDGAVKGEDNNEG